MKMFRFFAVALVLGLFATHLTFAEPNVECYGKSYGNEKGRGTTDLLEELLVRLLEEENPLSTVCRKPALCIGGNYYFEFAGDLEGYYGYVEYDNIKQSLSVQIEDDDGNLTLNFKKDGVTTSGLADFGPFESETFNIRGGLCKVKFDEIVPRGEYNPMVVVNLCTVCDKK